MARQHPNHDKVKAIVDGVVTSHPRIKAYLRQSKPANCPFPHFIQPSYGKGEGDPQKVGIAYIIVRQLSILQRTLLMLFMDSVTHPAVAIVRPGGQDEARSN